MSRTFLHFAIAALGYLIAGKLGQLLAIPPGFASAVWPAAGVALTCFLLLRKTPALLGVFVSSVIVNYTTNYTQFDSGKLLLATGIASGAVLQVLLGAWLIQRFIGKRPNFEDPKEIVSFSIIVAPVGCLASSINGTFFLWFLDFIEVPNIAFSWFTWWAGDSLGVAVFTPLLLILFSNRSKVSALRKAQFLIPSSIIFMTVLLLFSASLNSREQKNTEELEALANIEFVRIEEKIIIAINKLNAYAGLFKASDSVNFTDFIQFSETLLENDTTFQGVGWTKILDHNGRLALEKSLQAQGFEGFTLSERNNAGELIPAIKRDSYYPVIYIYPYAQNQAAHGFNLGSVANRLNTLQQAFNQQVPRATAPINLVQDVGSRAGLILYLPVSSSKSASLDEQKNEFIGYVGGVFVIENIVKSIIDDISVKGYALQISDITQSNEAVEIVSPSLIPSSFPAITKTLTVGGRQFDIVFSISKKHLMQIKDWNSWIILTSGFFITCLLNAFLLMLTGTNEKIRKEVLLKTEKLESAMLAAEAANEAKSNFLANMSHEIRTPLNAIMGLLDITLQSELNPKQRDFLGKAKLASKTLLALINQVLDFAKIEADKLEIESTHFSFIDTIKNLDAIFQPQAEVKGVSFAVNFNSTMPKTVIGDPLRTEQILLNLCSNALKFTEQGYIQVNLSHHSINAQHCEIIIEIKDSGIGVSDEQKAHLFESFRQADTTTTRKYGGTGLGLSIVKELIERMGGSIKLNSAVGIGSVFSLKIPYQLAENTELIESTEATEQFKSKAMPSAPAATAAIESTTEATTETEPTVASTPNTANSLASDLSGLRLLIIEDNEINQLVAKEMFSAEGAEILLASSGKFALNVLKRDTRFDVILLDIQMPDMDGYQVAEAINHLEDANAKRIPILAMTANVTPDDVKRCLAAGMKGHIAKPIDLVDAKTKIRQALA